MKKDQYFNLEVNMLNDDNIASMMLELDAAKSLGIYMMLLLHLRTKDDYEASCKPVVLKALARRNGVDLEMMERVLGDYGLFEVNEGQQTFRSPYLDRVMKRLEEKWKLNEENGKKGGRPAKRKKSAVKPATTARKPNGTQEKRGEDNKGITTVDNNSSNTGTPEASEAVAGGMKIHSLDDEGQQPLQPVLPWEKLVDELAQSQWYMNLAGQHSGLGGLFLAHQPLVIKLFKDHVKLYGKGDELLFFEDVRRYFSNYVAAGSVTCIRLREALLTDVRAKSDKSGSRFEKLMGGKRMYMGHVIPSDAPPRPDASAVWDDVRKKWEH